MTRFAEHYNGISVGDTVERVEGEWHGRKVGSVDVVRSIENEHLKFVDRGNGGHSPEAYRVVRYNSVIEPLVSRRTTEHLLRGGARDDTSDKSVVEW